MNYSLRVCPKQWSKWGISTVSAAMGLLFAGWALAQQSHCRARPGGLDIQMHGQNNVALQLFSDSFAHLLLSDSELEWSLGKLYFTRKGGFSSFPRTSMVLLHAWLSQASVMQETFLTANNPSSSFTSDISTFLHLILFLLFFFFFFHRLNIYMSYPVWVVVLMDALPTKTLGFRWLILCDCNGL